MTKLQQLYANLNEKWFEGKLPTKVKIKFSRLYGLEGSCTWEEGKLPEIKINRALNRNANLVELFVLHEMTHLRLGHEHFTAQETHPDEFYAERDRLYKLGAYRELL